MADILSIATAVPRYKHQQKDLLVFMQQAYGCDEIEARKLGFLYRQSEIETRYSVLPDFSPIYETRDFIPTDRRERFPSLDQRMDLYEKEALPLAMRAISSCLASNKEGVEITHLITVSCTGMSAPGLDLQIMEAMGLAQDTFRTSVNFMGCYAAIHALKMAQMICDGTPGSHVLIVAVELCTLHFQETFTPDNAASSLLFADGAAAVLLSSNQKTPRKSSIRLQHFYSQVNLKGKQDMSWKLSSQGFLMQLSSYVPQLIQADIAALVTRALGQNQMTVEDITHWCLHPGGKKILEAIQQQLHLCDCRMGPSKKVLANYGNMSSPTILFVLKEIMDMDDENERAGNIFGVAFGPGLTMESFIARKTWI